MEQSYRARHQTEEQQKFRGLGLQDQRPSDQQGENACQVAATRNLTISS